MDLCDSMLNPGGDAPKLSVNTSEAMLAVIGFLEACAPRMIELVEAAASGALSEATFEEVLICNDRLQKQLSDIETAALTESTATTTAASAAPTNDLTAQFDDLLLGPMDDPSSASFSAAPMVGMKSTGEDYTNAGVDIAAGEDDDDDDEKKPPAVEKSSSNDEFDNFFAERQSG